MIRIPKQLECPEKKGVHSQFRYFKYPSNFVYACAFCNTTYYYDAKARIYLRGVP